MWASQTVCYRESMRRFPFWTFCTHTRPSCPVPCWSMTVPPSPLSCWPALTSLQSNLSTIELLDLWSTTHILPAFFSSCNDIVHLLSGSRDLRQSRRFFLCSLSRLCLLLSEFKVNPPQNCARAWASVPCWSPPRSTVPGSTKRAVLENGTECSH